MGELIFEFMKDEGRRLFFMFLATIFGVAFMAWGPTPEVKGAGVTILTGVAMYCFNRMRGTAAKTENGEQK
jgi:hypothetical protein